MSQGQMVKIVGAEEGDGGFVSAFGHLFFPILVIDFASDGCCESTFVRPKPRKSGVHAHRGAILRQLVDGGLIHLDELLLSQQTPYTSAHTPAHTVNVEEADPEAVLRIITAIF